MKFLIVLLFFPIVLFADSYITITPFSESMQSGTVKNALESRNSNSKNSLINKNALYTKANHTGRLKGNGIGISYSKSSGKIIHKFSASYSILKSNSISYEEFRVTEFSNYLTAGSSYTNNKYYNKIYNYAPVDQTQLIRFLPSYFFNYNPSSNFRLHTGVMFVSNSSTLKSNFKYSGIDTYSYSDSSNTTATETRNIASYADSFGKNDIRYTEYSLEVPLGISYLIELSSKHSMSIGSNLIYGKGQGNYHSYVYSRDNNILFFLTGSRLPLNKDFRGTNGLEIYGYSLNGHYKFKVNDKFYIGVGIDYARKTIEVESSTIKDKYNGIDLYDVLSKNYAALGSKFSDPSGPFFRSIDESKRIQIYFHIKL